MNIEKRKTRAPFPWFGGKGNLKIKNAILKLIPPHIQYVEPFGGGSILIAKEPCKVEVYNDVNRGVVNFFRVISDVEYFGKFMVRASLLPISRELYEEYMRTWPAIHDPVEQAVRWYYIAQQSFGGCLATPGDRRSIRLPGEWHRQLQAGGRVLRICQRFTSGCSAFK